MSELDAEAIKAEQKRELASAISNGDSERAAELEALLAGDDELKKRPSRKQSTNRLKGKDRQERA